MFLSKCYNPLPLFLSDVVTYTLITCYYLSKYIWLVLFFVSFVFPRYFRVAIFIHLSSFSLNLLVFHGSYIGYIKTTDCICVIKIKES